MAELSVIIPFCNEYPQVLFTIQNIAQELRDRVDFEIIAINNFCDEVAAQGKTEDPAGDSLKATMRQNDWLKVIDYRDKLSHWQAKNMGVLNSTGRFLWFCDAHCIVSRDSLFRMFEYYKQNHERLNGTLHLPLTYKIMETKKLIYKLVAEPDHGYLHYSFTPYRDAQEPYIVPCMSTCGMIMTREIYNQLGCWPRELGIYGGGENFVNFTLAVLGKTVNIMPGGPLFHHGAPREYYWNYTDHKRNQIIAAYIYGGRKFAELFTAHCRGDQRVLQAVAEDVFNKCGHDRDYIKNQQVISIMDWLSKWTTDN
jgi:glycosyltransferase involved in cell wall biosynthesis